MSKSYKKKKEVEEEMIETSTISKKEQYELMKKKKEESKLKKDKKNSKKIKSKKKQKKTYQTNLGARIFAIVMLILMIGSVVVSVAAYFTY